MPFFLAGMLSALSTALSPSAAETNLWLFVFVRFLQVGSSDESSKLSALSGCGILCGLRRYRNHRCEVKHLSIYWTRSITNVRCRWAPLYQTASFIALLTNFSPLGVVITNPIAGAVSYRSYAMYSNWVIFCLVKDGWNENFSFLMGCSDVSAKRGFSLVKGKLRRQQWSNVPSSSAPLHSAGDSPSTLSLL